ncbi:MAG: imelysin family protein [Pseudomonadota bacterium]
MLRLRDSRSITLRQVPLLLLLAALLSSAAVQAASPNFDHKRLAETARTKYILPGYQALNTVLGKLSEALQNLCQRPSEAQLKSTRMLFVGVVSAWGRIESIRFGPVVADNRFERIFYWPDRKGRGARQVRRLLAAKDEPALRPGGLAKKSVAVQGVSALEIALFGKNSEVLADDSTYRCRYAVAIVQNLSEVTTEIISAWSRDGAFEKVWRSAGEAGNQVYLKPSEVTLDIVSAFDIGLQNLYDLRLAPMAGLGKITKQRQRPPLTRSRTTMALIGANLEGLEDLLFGGGLAEAFIASSQQRIGREADLLASARDEFRLTRKSVRSLTTSFGQLSPPDQKAAIVPIAFAAANIRQNVVGEIKAAAGLSLGFNASDGD